MQKNKAVSARELKRLRSAADKSHAKEKGYKRFSNLEFAMSILLVIIIVLSARLLIAEPKMCIRDRFIRGLLQAKTNFGSPAYSVWMAHRFDSLT